MNIHVGMLAPHAYFLELDADGVDINLSQVEDAGVRLFVQKPRSSQAVEWTAVVSGKTATRIVLTHAFQAGDLDVAGVYAIFARLPLSSGGTVESQRFALPVLARFDITRTT